MPKLRIFYILSLVVLGVLVGFTVFKPMAVGGEYSEVQRKQLLETEDGWIIQFDIINHEGRDIDYIIEVSVDGEPSKITVTVRDESMFTYIKHIKPHMLTEGEVTFMVYGEDSKVPLEEGTYCLKKAEFITQ
ncbi:hypothetical protein ACFLX4_00125 [Chloroflexota bacterium]